jgi:hypothetical protein
MGRETAPERRKEPVKRFTGSEKMGAVTRVIRGEEPARVAAEMNVSVERLHRWERIFMEGGLRSLNERGDRRARVPLFNSRGFLQWAGLVFLLFAIVYAASRFMQQGAQP